MSTGDRKLAGKVDESKYFDILLSVFWLRPETALWRSLDIEAMRGFEFATPSLDLGCGDGIFSFIRAGGVFDISFDAFQSIENLEAFFDKVDIFDSSKPIDPVIKKPPIYQIDHGFDHKENLLRKAYALGLYKNLIVGDANQRLPFDDNSFCSVFSNILYWLDDPKTTLVEIKRILRPGGRCCIMLPNRTFPEFSFYYSLFVKDGNENFRFLEKMDRGRIADNIKHAKSYSEWLNIINSSGIKVIGHSMHLSKTVIQIWDIGLRPLFPVFHKMVLLIDKVSLLEIKKEWIGTLKMFLEPVFKMDDKLTQGVEPAFHCFILEKRE